MCVCFIVWTICSSYAEVQKSKAAAKGAIGMIWIFTVAYALAWSGLLVAYTVEILPFKIRAKGLMIMNFFIQVALTINQYVNPFGFSHLNPRWKFYTIYAVSFPHLQTISWISTNTTQCWIFIEVIFVTVFYVETRGPTLEEVAKIFDGDDAEVGNIDLETLESDLMTSSFDKGNRVKIEHIRRV
jgi:hypothetical protein